MVTLYKMGETTRQIAARYGVGHERVGRLIRSAGVRLRLDGLTEQQIDEARALYVSGWSLARIADTLGSTAMTVRSRLIERGVQMRDTHGR
jgi:DNA-directed RNA polymerase specialized sigma24 family protein